MSEIKKFEKKARVTAILTTVGVLSVLAGSFAFVLNQGELSDTIKEKTAENIVLNDSVAELKHEVEVTVKKVDSLVSRIDTTVVIDKKRKHVLDVVTAYFEARNAKKIKAVLNTLDNKLEKFYTEDNTTKAFAARDFKEYWKTYPNSRYFTDFDKIVINQLPKGGYEVIVDSQFAENGQIQKAVQSTFKINPAEKIYYIKDVIID